MTRKTIFSKEPLKHSQNRCISENFPFAVVWSPRSPNYHNNNNFCNTNTDGSANNNNANNSWGVLAGFCYAGSNGVTKVKDDPSKRRDAPLGENP